MMVILEQKTILSDLISLFFVLFRFFTLFEGAGNPQ